MSGFLVVTWRGGSPMTEEQSADTEDPANLVVEEVRIFDFDVATAVVPAGDGFTASVDPGWTIGSRPNGGYLLALATRAALALTGQPHPLAVSAHFVAPPSLGPADLEVHLLRSGRSVANARVTLVQEGQPRLEELVSAGRLAEGRPRREAGDARLGALQRQPPAGPARDAPGGRRPAARQFRAGDHALGSDRGDVGVRAHPAGRRLVAVHRAGEAPSGRLVRRGGRGVGRARTSGGAVPPARRRPSGPAAAIRRPELPEGRPGPSGIGLTRDDRAGHRDAQR